MLTEAPPLPLQKRISLVRPPPAANLLRAKLHYGLKFKRLGIEMPEGVFHDTRRIYDLIEFDWRRAYSQEILHTRHELHVVSSDADRIVVRLVRRGQLQSTKQFVDLADSYYALPREPCELYPIDGWGDPSPIPVGTLDEAALEFFGRPMTARLLQQFATATKRIDVRIAGRELRLKGITYRGRFIACQETKGVEDEIDPTRDNTRCHDWTPNL